MEPYSTSRNSRMQTCPVHVCITWNLKCIVNVNRIITTTHSYMMPLADTLVCNVCGAVLCSAMRPVVPNNNNCRQVETIASESRRRKRRITQVPQSMLLFFVSSFRDACIAPSCCWCCWILMLFWYRIRTWYSDRDRVFLYLTSPFRIKIKRSQWKRKDSYTFYLFYAPCPHEHNFFQFYVLNQKYLN